MLVRPVLLWRNNGPQRAIWILFHHITTVILEDVADFHGCIVVALNISVMKPCRVQSTLSRENFSESVWYAIDVFCSQIWQFLVKVISNVTIRALHKPNSHDSQCGFTSCAQTSSITNFSLATEYRANLGEVDYEIEQIQPNKATFCESRQSYP
ncbi:unnamed protein product [Calypogeia fissa]